MKYQGMKYRRLMSAIIEPEFYYNGGRTGIKRSVIGRYFIADVEQVKLLRAVIESRKEIADLSKQVCSQSKVSDQRSWSRPHDSDDVFVGSRRYKAI